MIGKRSAVAAWILLPAALIAVATAGAQVPDVGPGRRIGDCWTDANGVNHCGGGGAPVPKPDRPPRDGGGSGGKPPRAVPDKDRAEKIADEGDKLSKRGDWAGAESEYRRSISVYDGDARVWFNLGASIQEQGRHQEALDAFKRAADLGNKQAKKQYEKLLAWLTAQQQARREAAARSRGQDQARQRTHEAAARLDGRTGGYAAAARLWRDFLRGAPDDVYALSELARYSYLAHLVDPNLPKETVDEAVGALARAIRLEPANGRHHRAMMLLLARVGRADEAAAYAAEAAARADDLKDLQTDVYYAMEWALDQRNYDAAARLLDAGARVLPPDWIKVRKSHVRMAQYNAAVAAKDEKGAVSASRALVELYPNDVEYRGLLGAALFRSGDTVEGTAVFVEGMRLQRDSIGQGLVFGKFIAAHVDETKDWRALLEGARGMIAELPVRDKWDRASVAGRRAELAAALLRLNRPVEARAELDAYLNHPPELGDAWFFSMRVLGDDFEKMGLIEFSILVNERALALKPGDADATAKLAQLRAAAAREGLALRPLVPAVPSGPGGSGAVSPDAPPADGNGFERSLATSGADLVRHARELRRQAGLPPREPRTVVPVPFEVWEKKVREGKGLTPAELASFSRNDWNYLGKLIAELHRDGETSGGALTGRELGRGASEAADRSGEWIARNRETVEAAADLLEYGSIAALPASLPVSVALGSAETSLTVLAKLLILKSEHPDKKDVPKALAWIVGPEAVKKIGGDKLKAVFIEAGIPGVKAEQLGFLTIKEAVDAAGNPSGR